MNFNLNGGTRLFPIIGDLIEFVKSPQSLTASFAAQGHDGICISMQVLAGDFDEVMRGLARMQNVDALLITMPHKSTAFNYCAASSETSRLHCSVSVMRRSPNGYWHGDVLDGRAFVKAQVDAGAVPNGARILLVGAGSAGAPIAIVLLHAGARELRLHDADETRVDELIGLAPDPFRGRMVSCPADPTGCEMVCNATPMGLGSDDPLPVDADALTSSMSVGAVIAGHGVTPFLQAAQAAGCKTANGMQMVDSVQEMMVGFMLGEGP